MRRCLRRALSPLGFKWFAFLGDLPPGPPPSGHAALVGGGHRRLAALADRTSARQARRAIAYLHYRVAAYFRSADQCANIMRGPLVHLARDAVRTAPSAGRAPNLVPGGLRLFEKAQKGAVLEGVVVALRGGRTPGLLGDVHLVVAIRHWPTGRPPPRNTRPPVGRMKPGATPMSSRRRPRAPRQD